MNYSGKFLPGASHGPATHFAIDPVQVPGVPTFQVPDAHLLFSGDYLRVGSDLIISNHLTRIVVPDYFKGHSQSRPLLVSSDGAPISSEVVDALTGYTAYAQADPQNVAGKVVGHIIKMTGSASIVRNGVTIVANVGDVVYQSDVVQTGSSSTIGLVLDDGSTFNLSANSRFLLGDLTFDPNSTSNSAFLTLVQGAASFVAGQVAKTGDMRIATPVASIGIRGTAVNLEISSTDGTVSISVVDQRDGALHAVQVFNNAGVLIGTVTSNGASLTLTPTATFDVLAQQIDKTADQVAREFNVFQQVLSTYDAAKQIFPNLPQHTDNSDRQNGNDANPKEVTRFASSAPLNPPGTEYHPPAATPQTTSTETPPTISVTINASPAAGAPVSTSTSLDAAGEPPIPVKLTSLPFVVTPGHVTAITSGPGDHKGPVMSASGDVVYDPDGAIYFYDRAANTTTTIASPVGGWTYGLPTISSDGRYILYQGSNGNGSYIFVYGTDSSDSIHYRVQTELAPGDAPATNGDGSTILAHSADGSIAIYGLQGNLKGTITPAAVGSSGALWTPAISADGHVVVFWNSDSGAAGGAGHLFSFDFSSGQFTHIGDTSVGAGATAPTVSADGHLIAYQSTDATGHSQIYLYDLNVGAVVFQTAGASSSYSPVLSPDGHFIVFTSDAALTAEDDNAIADVYIVDVTHPAAPAYRLVSEGSGLSSAGGVAISAGGQYVAFGSSSHIFFADPTSGHSAVITETANSPEILTAKGSIAVTGDYTGVKIAAADQFGVATPHFKAEIDQLGNIRWTFTEPKSDFDENSGVAPLSYGQDATQKFVITLSADDGSVTIPVFVTVHNGIQPSINVADFAPVAKPVTLQDGQQDASYTITSSALLAGVVDVDGPSLSISSLSLRSGSGSLSQVDGQTWSYTPDPGFSGRVMFDYGVTDSIKSAASTASLDIALPLAIVSIAPDSGVNGDFITNSGNLTVSGTNGTLFAGERIQISSDNGGIWFDVVQTSATTWSLADPISHATNFTYQARVIDSGNVTINSTSQAVVVDTTAPTAAVAITAITQDTGTAGDFVTSDTTLTVSGSNGALGAGEKIQLSSNGGATWVDVVQNTTTSWSLVDGIAHPSSFTYQVRIVDTAGNIGTTASQAVTIDNTAPTAAMAITAITQDTGTAGDFVTSDATLTVSGSNGALGAGEKIQLSSDSGTSWVDVVQNTTTSWSLVDGTAHPSSFTYQVRIVDTAGNIGTTASQAVTIDTTAPTAAMAITAINQDTGTAGDFVTSDATLTVSGSNGALGAGEKIQLSSDGGTSWVDVTQATATSWSYVDPATHAASFTYQVRIVDTAGNIGTTASQVVTIDTTASSEAVAITAITQDTGTAGDFVTSDTTLTVSGSNGALGAGEKIQLSSDGGTTWADVTQSTATSWSYLDPEPHASSFTYQTRIIDSAGNVGTTASQAVTIDTTAPSEAVAITAINQDTGTAGDFITSDTTLTVSGTNGALASGEKIQVSSDNGATWADVTQSTATSWSYLDPAPHASSFTYQTRIIDSAGNVGTTASQAVTIDTTAPSEAVAITAINQDTGTAGDFITSDTTLTVSGTNGALASGEKIQVSSDNGATWADVTQSTATSWSYLDPAPHASSFTYQTRIIDSAGNIGTTASQAVTIDTTAPSEAVAITAINQDTGTAGDFITNDTTLTVSGTNEALASDEKIQVSSNGGATWADVTRIIDSAGNVGTTASQAVTIDATAPTITISNVGGPTNQANQTITGMVDVADAGATVTVYDGSTAIRTAIVQGDGSWSAQVTLANGSNSLTAKVSDLAGNTTTSNAVVYTLSTTGPAVTEHLTSDTGSSALDQITSNPALSGTGLANTTVHFTIDGTLVTTTTLADGSGNWSFTPSGLGDGLHTIVASQTDTFNNTGSASLTFTLDTTAPSAPVISTVTDDVTPVTGTVADNGSSNDTTLTIAGTAEAGSTVTIYDTDGTTVLGSAVATGGSYSITTSALGEGSHTLTAKATDAAGNQGVASTAFHVGIDSVSPTDITLSNASVAENSAVGTVVGSFSDVDLGATGTASFTLLDDAAGRFAITSGNLVVVGSLDYETAQSHQITARVTDSAGNTFDKTLTVFVTDVAGVTLNGDAGANVLVGTPEADTLNGLGGNDRLQGLGGNDTLDGGNGFDRAVYSDAAGPVTVNLAAGTGSGAGVGSDTLISIEAAMGGDFADTFDATGFTGSSTQPGVALGQSAFEGRGGDDVITGRINDLGQSLTRVEYLSASAAVTVDLAARTGQGTAAGDVANVGHDTFTNALQGVYGSAYNDTLYGSNNVNFTYEVFEGRGGNDYIDGRGGYDIVTYNNDPATATGITVQLAAGTVSGDGTVGTDTLRDVEAVRGTNFDDAFDATGYGLAGALNASSTNGTFNDFAGAGGNDTIIGNGNTRLNYSIAQAAITVDLQITAGTAVTVAGSATGATEGTDTFTGVNAVQASVFADTLLGSSYNNTFTALGGDDYIDGRGGFDTANYNNLNTVTGGVAVNMAAGTVTGDASSGTDTLRNIEAVQGTGYVDTYDATGYGLAGALNVSTSNGNFNQFEGLGGDDSITGNGNTRVLYSNATGPVNVTIGAGGTGSASGDVSTGHDTFTGGVNSVIGSNSADSYNASGFNAGFNSFQGNGGNDTITGNGSTQVQYSNATSGVTITIGAGGAGSASGDGSVGSDTFVSGVNSAAGGNLTDTYNASGYGTGLYNSFQGNGGNDTITGNGSTQAQYNNATSSVTITITAGGAGSASGDSSVGSDTFVSGVNSALGGNSNDTYNASGYGIGLYNSFQGNAGNDTITGNGSTQVQYNSATSSVTITIGAGGTGSASGNSSVGTDSFTGVNSALGSNFDDTYNASAFNAGQFNSFHGNGGNDTITGNGSTQIEYFGATAGVNVNLTTGIASGNASVGTDTITGGVSSVEGSNFADIITGSLVNDSLFGNGGNDTLAGADGNDYLAGGSGADTFVYANGGGADYIGDFDRSEGDRIDLTGVTGIFTLADIQARATQQASDTLIDFGSGNTITLANVTVGSLVASDFIFNNSITGTSANDVLVGTSQADGIFGLGGNDRLQGLGGNDTLDGGNGFDRAVYSDAAGPVTVNLAAGIGSGAGVGSDTLISIEAAMGGDFADTFDATGFTGSSTQPGVALGQSAFEGRGGDDVITGRINDLGQSLTRVEYLSASAAVTVDLAARTGQGTAAGDVANVGHDTFTNALQGVYGSAYNDTLYGSNNVNFTYEVFEGRGGNDYIDGRGGYDIVTYNNDPATATGITVQLAAGTVSGDGTVGTDTLRDVEAVRGTNFDDAFDATGYGLAGALNASSTNGTFNDFAGAGGNDTIIGNGNTRLNYSIAQAAITVDLQITAGTAVTVAGSATGATEGTDTFTGVNAVQASVFADTLLGSSYNNTFTALGGDDYIDGRGGFDTANYNNLNTVTGGVAVNMAAGTVTGDASSGTDTLRNIEAVQGTGYVDTYDATGYGLAGALNVSTSNGNFNQFEGLGGDDSITGNGNTRVLYSNATGPVNVTIGAGGTGSASGDVSTGHDTFTGGVNSAIGSNSADSYNASGFNAGFNSFQGNGGNDTITGNGSTQVQYSNATSSVTIDLIAGTAIGNGSVGTDTITGGVNSVVGSNFDDVISGTNNATVTDVYFGGGGNDTINGRGGYDLANYNDSSISAAIIVDLAAGTVVGDSSVGSDILQGVELVRGTRFADTFDATGFNGSSTNAGSYDTFNTFEGMAGNDTVTGNGNTRVDYSHALAAVTVDLTAGTGQGVAAGDVAGVGFDTFTGGVNSIRGSNFNDTLFGSNNATGAEEFIGGAGNDAIDGRGGFDRAMYSASSDDATTGGVVVDLAAGTVSGDASVGSDTLKSIESIRGTNFADTFTATGFSGSSVNAGSNGTLNEFEGEAGNDTITGNGNTRIAFYHAAGGVNVDLSTGTSTSLASGDLAHVGTDTFTGVAAVRGSDFGDQISGKSGSVILDGRGGDDILVANGGANTLIGGEGNDQFKFKAALANGATISDFAGNGAAAGDSIDFEGFGTAAQGATFTFFSAAGADSIWQIHSGLDGHNELITLKGIATSAGVHSSDYLFAT
ncbi:Ig-like domain-containing protein [Bradyrhizobium xenonodulans]|uniref:Ig-like domain-containing protein n=1 Tax=Bradyrhizobium xenonodulans TaxID=2736875 RepID=A0ABY7MKR4_9BRAD|nr:Ig-like domain-containing protein [Bradyrhizobium xenonodulans]WBL77252.1 Ig-like domain-containing protein [Bradyrhizobium xenonodulans]